MSEEQEQGGGFFSNLKNQIITGAGAILATVGTVFVDEIKSIVGIADEEEGDTKTEMVQQQSQSNNQQVIINIPEQKPAETKTVIVKEKAATPPPPKKTETEKRKEEGLDW